MYRKKRWWGWKWVLANSFLVDGKKARFYTLESAEKFVRSIKPPSTSKYLIVKNITVQ